MKSLFAIAAAGTVLLAMGSVAARAQNYEQRQPAYMQPLDPNVFGDTGTASDNGYAQPRSGRSVAVTGRTGASDSDFQTR